MKEGRIKVKRGHMLCREEKLRKTMFLGQWLRWGQQREPTVTFSQQSATCTDGKEEEEEEGEDDKQKEGDEED